jgi:SAM-dependent methyltransferase
MNDIQKEILEHWNAYIYEQDEDETAMAEYIVREMGDRPLRILEAACGGGKLCVPLARAGHDVTGIDQDQDMLFYLYEKSKNLPNLHIVQADMLAKPWENGYDAVILGANLLVNITTDRDYKRAQINLLDRAHDALKTGGRLFIDYDCPLELSKWIPANTEWVCFEGKDDRGTYGKYVVVNGTASDRNRIVNGSRRWEITPTDAAAFVHTEDSYKYFPTIEQVCAWLYRAGFIVESINGGYNGEAFDREHRRAVIWARKVVF